jgi:hypothetical protein
MTEELKQILDYPNARREYRMKAAQWVLSHPETFPDLLEYTFGPELEMSIRASWVLEFVCLERLDWLYPFLDRFFGSLASVTHESVLRPLSHLCERLCLAYYTKYDSALRQAFNQTHKDSLVECCFDWMREDHTVATQVRAMTCLYYLGTEIEWIHPELKQVIEERIHQGSAGSKNRGSKILDLIKADR